MEGKNSFGMVLKYEASEQIKVLMKKRERKCVRERSGRFN